MFRKKFFSPTTDKYSDKQQSQRRMHGKISHQGANNCSHSTESSNAAEIIPKARDPDQCMHSKPCQAYSSQKGANETAQPEGCK